MGAAPPPSRASPQSAIQNLIAANPLPSSSPHSQHLHNLALQVAHNLRFQHGWTDLYIHCSAPSCSASSDSSSRQFPDRDHSTHPCPPPVPLPRPLLSGLPPQRLYVHPDEQIALLKAQKQRQRRNRSDKGGTEGGGGGGDEEVAGKLDLRPEREWVLPTHLREKWTLGRFAEVLDAVSLVPDGRGGKETDGGVALKLFEDAKSGQVDGDGEEGLQDNGGESEEENEWRKTKRVLLATLDDDSTVVYYIVHDGIVKPRQN